jgi:S1-C subfamily serine protease
MKRAPPYLLLPVLGLAAAPDGLAPAAASAEARGGLGLQLADLRPDPRHELGLAEDLRGSVIERVALDCSAEKAGPAAGGVIVQVDGAAVQDAAGATEALRDKRSTGVPLRVVRGGTIRWMHLAAPVGEG